MVDEGLIISSYKVARMHETLIGMTTGRKWQFGASYIAVFSGSFLLLGALGFAPDDQSVAAEPLKEQPADFARLEEPTRIVVDAIDLDVEVRNPESTDIAVLDKELKEGAVRYPQSGLLGEDRAMFLFGHSSYLPIVHNSAYKAFNGIQNLALGDVVRVISETREYHYRVKQVSTVEAAATSIDLSKGGKRLILSTCNSFGDETERFVVEAEFVGTYPLAS